MSVWRVQTELLDNETGELIAQFNRDYERCWGHVALIRGLREAIDEGKQNGYNEFGYVGTNYPEHAPRIERELKAVNNAAADWDDEEEEDEAAGY